MHKETRQAIYGLIFLFWLIGAVIGMVIALVLVKQNEGVPNWDLPASFGITFLMWLWIIPIASVVIIESIGTMEK